MGGGLMQLVAYGAQDVYLTGNPQITFFKVVYRRHTNFSMEAIKQVFDGTTGFGNTVSATISRNGDLVHRMYLEHDASFDSDNTENTGLCERYGESLIKECEIEIGGQRIDKHYALWNRVWSDLTESNPSGYFGQNVTLANGGTDGPAGNGTLYQLMTGNGLGLQTIVNDNTNELGAGGQTVNGFDYASGGALTVNKIFVPLNFWFCRNPGLSLPLIALQYHEVKVKMTFSTLQDLAREFHASNGTASAFLSSSTNSSNFDLWIDYIYLDTDERRRFAQVSHEYLIEQLQRSVETTTSQTPSFKLNFNHPVKELIWCSRNIGSAGRNQVSSSLPLDPSAGPVSVDTMAGNWKLKLNGHDRFSARDTKYFTRTQIWQHHTGYGSLPTYGTGTAGALTTEALTLNIGIDGIAVYSFALKPEEHQPSGTCNFSRIDNAQLIGSSLQIDGEDGELNNVAASVDILELTIFAVNYNVLRIMSGMGGLAYSN